MKFKGMTVGFFVASSLAFGALVLVATAAAKAPASARYGVVNATVYAATDHEIGTSTAFPNYTNGAIDNFYSLAYSHIDNSPFAEGTASPADTGPLGQTGASQASYTQPQYADARWPGAKSGQTASFGNAGGPSASATAGNYTAKALSSEASGSGSPGAPVKIAGPKGLDRRLRLALAAWKTRWLGRLGLDKSKLHFASRGLPVTVPVTTPTVPGVTVPTVPLPGGTTTTSTTTTTSSGPTSTKRPPNGAVISSTVAELDPHSGAVLTSGESSLGTVKVAGGQIVLRHIDVSAKITNTGKPKGSCSTEVGGATIAGVPVTIDQSGVHVQGQGSGLPYGQADDAINTALKSAGVQLYTVKPEIKKSPNELSITCTGVHVAFAQPVDQSGVPSQTLDHIVGEVFVDSLAAPAPPLPKLPSVGTGVGSSLPVTGGTTGTSSGGTSFGSPSTSSGSGSTGGGSSPTSFTSALSKPAWLLVAYLIWQSLMVATGATLWRWRAGGMT